jgi:hypothetical protein
VVGFVQKEREVRFGLFEGPGGCDFAFVAVHNGDVVGLGDIDENARRSALEAEGLGGGRRV